MMGASDSCVSEVELQSELHLPLGLGRGDLAERRSSQAIAYLCEHGRVGNIERLRAELEPPGLGDRDSLLQREIDISNAGVADNTLAGVAEGSRRLGYEVGRVEPLAGRT